MKIINKFLNLITKFRSGRELLAKFLDFFNGNLHLSLKILNINSNILLDVNSGPEVRYRVTSAKREETTMEWLKKLDKNKTLYDIGANVGCYSLIAAKEFNIQKIHAFEPFPINYSKCIQNVIKNNLSERISVYNFAIDSENKIQTLFHTNQYEKIQSGSSGHQIGNPIDETGNIFKSNFEFLINTYSIDNLQSISKIPSPDYIKIDVDGRELEILKGAKETLNSGKIKSIMIEVNLDQNDIIELLSYYGFTVAVYGEHGNTIFERKV